MSKMKKWIIKKLGGHTVKELEREKEWADTFQAVINPKEISKNELLDFLLFDLFHSENNIKKFTIKEMSSIFTKARMFTYYNSEFLKTKKYHKDLDEFLDYLKNDCWKKVYGKTYTELKVC